MSADSRASHLSRRAFLCAVAAGATALAAPAALSVGVAPAWAATHTLLPPQAPALADTPLRIGVVVADPPSSPELAPQLLAGLQLGLAGSRPVELLVQRYATNPGEALAALRTLAGDAQVGALVAMISAASAGHLHKELQERQLPLLIATPGVNIARPQHESPWVFRSTLGAWQSAWAMGAWAAQTLGRRATMLASFYESGYDTPFAFRLGFEHGGGTIGSSIVTHTPHAPADELPRLLAALRQDAPDLVFAAYSGRPASSFLRAYSEADLAGRLPLLGPGFLADQAQLHAHGQYAQGVYSALGWLPASDSATGRAFAQQYRAATGTAPGAFAALGYDSGLLLHHALGQASGGDALRQALHEASFEGSQGTMTFDPHTRELHGPLFLRQMQPGKEGLQQRLLTRLAPPPSDEPALAAARKALRSGWVNAYLAV